MPMPSFELTGPGALGMVLVRPGQRVTKTAAGLPTTVKLGRLPADPACKVVKLADHINLTSGWKPPDTIDWATKAENSIRDPLGNLSLGNCVIAGKGHHVGAWSANDSDSGGEILATAEEAVRAYHEICGPGDNGCVITRVLDVMRTQGIKFGGMPRRIDGYASVDWTQPDLLRAAIFLFGGVTIGFNFPKSWLSSAIWDATNSPTVGGHDVAALRYDARGVYVASWGREYLMTWAAIAQRGRIDECYALLSPNWTNNDKLSPAGVDVAGLTRALTEIGGGVMPDPAPPTPPAPPAPPTPPPSPWTWPTYDLQMTDATGHEVTGTLTPRPVVPPPAPADTPQSVRFQLRTHAGAAMLSGMLFALGGVETETQGTDVVVRNKDLTPEQWAQIISAIAAFANVILSILGKH